MEKLQSIWTDRTISEGIEIELAGLEDAGTIAVLSKNFIEVGLGWSWTPARVRRKIHSKKALVILARAGDDLVGFAIMRYFPGEAHLDLLGVKTAYQHNGIGTGLLEWLEKSAQAVGILKIKLEVRATNRSARMFYRHLEYREEKILKGYYQGQESAVRMVRHLPALFPVPISIQ